MVAEAEAGVPVDGVEGLEQVSPPGNVAHAPSLAWPTSTPPLPLADALAGLGRAPAATDAGQRHPGA
jgi:hypothetical protein